MVVLLLIFFLFRVPKSSQNTAFDSLTFVQKLLKLDPLGSLFIIAAVICILLALQWGGQSMAWNSPTVIGLLIAFPLLLMLFAVVQWKQGMDATLPLWLLKQRSMIAAVLFSFFFSMPSYLVRISFILPITLISLPNISPVRILHSDILSSRQEIDSYAERSSVSSSGNTADLCCGPVGCFSHRFRILCQSLAFIATSLTKLTGTYSFHSSYWELLLERLGPVCS